MAKHMNFPARPMTVVDIWGLDDSLRVVQNNAVHGRLRQEMAALDVLRSGLAHETVHIGLYYKVKQLPIVLSTDQYPLQPPAVTFVPYPPDRHDVGGAAATMFPGERAWAVPPGTALTTLTGAVEALVPDLTLAGESPVPSCSLAGFSPQPALAEDSSAPQPIETKPVSGAAQPLLLPHRPGQFGARIPVAVTTEEIPEHGLFYRITSEPVSGVVLILRAEVSSTFLYGLVRIVDGIRAALCLLLVLVLVLAALARRLDVVAFLLVLLATCLHYGRRGESDDDGVLALSSKSSRRGALSMA